MKSDIAYLKKKKKPKNSKAHSAHRKIRIPWMVQ